MAGAGGVPGAPALPRSARLGPAPSAPARCGGRPLTDDDAGPAALTPAGTWVRRAVGWLVPLALLAVAAWLLGDRWDEVRRSGGLPGVGPVLFASAIHVAANAVSVTTWRRMVAIAGVALGWAAAAWVWAASQLARYGLSGAQVAGRAVLARRYGVSATAGAVTALVEAAWQLAITGVLVLGTLPWWLPGTAGLTSLVAVAAVPVALLVLGSLAPMRFLRLAATAAAWGPVRRVTRDRLATGLEGVELSRSGAAGLTGLFTVNTLLRLAAFAVLLSAVGGDLRTDLLAAVGAYGLGQLAGRLAFFAPGGLGAQEGAAALVLTPVLGAPVALLLVAVVRLAELTGELVFLGVARWRRPVSAPARAR